MHSNLGHVTRLAPGEVDRLIRVHFPFLHADGRQITIEELAPNLAQLRMTVNERSLRPDHTISNAALFELAEAGLLAVLLAELGETAPRLAATTLTISFLGRARALDVLCEARLLKRGRRLAVGEIELRSAGDPALIGHVTATCAALPGAVSR